MSELSFLADWRTRLKGDQPGVVLVDPDHALEVYVGASDLGHPLLQIRSKIKPPQPEISELVLVSRDQADSHWVLSLTLQDTRFLEVFLRLAAHLVTASKSKPTPEAAWLSVADSLDEWKRLLRPRPRGLLSIEELRGLVGEMWLLLNRYAKTMSTQEAVTGWIGPLGSPQDFWFEGSGFHEAKSIGPSAPYIKVSSAHQLDQPEMELVVLQLPQVEASELGAVSLTSLLEQAELAFQQEGDSPDDLALRIRRLGVDVGESFYSDTWFVVKAVENFRVDAAFPAVRFSVLPLGIERVRYSLDRTAIAPFLVSTDYF